MKTSALILTLMLSLCLHVIADDTAAIYQTSTKFSPVSQLDEIVLRKLNEKHISPALKSSDGAFLRRVYLDFTGTVPTVEEARAFLDDKSPDKRAKLIDRLLDSANFADYWSMKWCDILRVKSEFPINLWPNAVQAYHHWVWDAIRKNKPYDQFARELLTSSGSNFRTPQVNFYRSTQNRKPAGFAKIAVQAFLCSRISTWPEYYRTEIEKLFSRIKIKGTSEWKEQIVELDPAPAEAMDVTMPDGSKLHISPDDDPRAIFAKWLINGGGKKWFAEAAVNRVWFWIFNRGIIQEPDDFRLKDKESGFFTRWFGHPAQSFLGNPPANPELLTYLGQQFIKSGFDFKALCRMIANSATYQQSCIPADGVDIQTAEKFNAVYPIHRIDAEVLRDIFTYLSNYKPKYMSVIPEPFTFIPGDAPTTSLADGSITSAFLEKFGRPARDTGLLLERDNQVTYSQRLFLLNSPVIQYKIAQSPQFKKLIRGALLDPHKAVDNIYLFTLSRHITDPEYQKLKEIYGIKSREELVKAFKKKGRRKRLTEKEKKSIRKRMRGYHTKGQKTARELVWMLINTKEFLFKH